MCLTADEVTMLLSFCLNATYCAFAGQFFKQSFGTAMGLPVSMMVANPVMEDLEERALLTYTRLCKSTIGVPHFHPMKCHLSIPTSALSSPEFSLQSNMNKIEASLPERTLRLSIIQMALSPQGFTKENKYVYG